MGIQTLLFILTYCLRAQTNRSSSNLNHSFSSTILYLLCINFINHIIGASRSSSPRALFLQPYLGVVQSHLGLTPLASLITNKPRKAPTFISFRLAALQKIPSGTTSLIMHASLRLHIRYRHNGKKDGRIILRVICRFLRVGRYGKGMREGIMCQEFVLEN